MILIMQWNRSNIIMQHFTAVLLLFTTMNTSRNENNQQKVIHSYNYSVLNYNLCSTELGTCGGSVVLQEGCDRKSIQLSIQTMSMTPTKN